MMLKPITSKLCSRWPLWILGLAMALPLLANAGTISNSGTISLLGANDSVVVGSTGVRAYGVLAYGPGAGFVELRETTVTGPLLRRVTLSAAGAVHVPWDANIPGGTRLVLSTNIPSGGLLIDTAGSR
jgi:hypothetical protein